VGIRGLAVDSHGPPVLHSRSNGPYATTHELPGSEWVTSSQPSPTLNRKSCSFAMAVILTAGTVNKLFRSCKEAVKSRDVV
jgi:hypothetical protein